MKRWGDKRYYSLDSYIKETFGEKLYKISLDGGMTCPNRDGTLDTRGCIFCSAGGSGDFASDRRLVIKEQLAEGKQLVSKKYAGSSYIAYFQAYTNTYASVSYLEKIFTEAIDDEEVKVLSIATRPDCLSSEILDLLFRLNQRKPVWVELGLQTIHETSANFIRRGYTLDVFEKAVYDLKKIGISVIVHTILYLPHETEDMMIETISYLNRLPIDGIKLQLLHILKGTDLANIYAKSSFHLPTMDEYFILLGKLLSHLRPDIVVHRLTGDGPKNLLLAPQWTGNKRLVLNAMQKYLKDADIWQGKEFSCQNHLHSIN
ncbi:MAG: TIGR01212 family radical SAM protein [Tyzzerella sp.]|nr:TIGR01212 family radical SAM protein [Tyzzerella sp.]